MGIENAQLIEQLTRLMDITHSLRCSVSVMREAMTASFAVLSSAQRQALASSIRSRVELLLEQADDLEGAQQTRERMAYEAHLLLRGLQE
jgi:hypothetical protein